MTLSPHIIVDNIDPELLERCLLYLKRVKQLKFVNIGAGAQVDRGMQFVERVHREIPHLRIVWRNLDKEDDTGILAKWTAEDLYAERVTRYLKWFQDNNVIFMPDNETSGDDNRIKLYARDEAAIARMLHADGLNGAFCRFATGNIQDGSQPGQPSQYPLLKPIFDAMNAGDIISPNEYRNAPGKSSAGHLFRYTKMWEAAGRELPTFIGEAGISVNYDPGIGYQVLGLSDADVCQLMLSDEMWYNNGAIDRSWYLAGGYTHETFRLRPGIFDYLENYYDKLPPVIVKPPDPPASTLPKFPTDFESRAKRGTANITSPVNMRSRPELDAPIVDSLKQGTLTQYIHHTELRNDERVYTQIGTISAAWIPVKVGTIQGWVWAGVASFAPVPPLDTTVLNLLYNNLVKASTRTRQMSLELATISDDLFKDAELLNALIQSQTPK